MVYDDEAHVRLIPNTDYSINNAGREDQYSSRSMTHTHSLSVCVCERDVVVFLHWWVSDNSIRCKRLCHYETKSSHVSLQHYDIFGQTSTLVFALELSVMRRISIIMIIRTSKHAVKMKNWHTNCVWMRISWYELSDVIMNGDPWPARLSCFVASIITALITDASASYRSHQITAGRCFSALFLFSLRIHNIALHTGFVSGLFADLGNLLRCGIAVLLVSTARLRWVVPVGIVFRISWASREHALLRYSCSGILV